MSGLWDAILLTPGSTGIPAAVLDAASREEAFTIEVQPQNTHSLSPDHEPSGTQALFMGAGVEGYRLAMETLIAKEADV